MIYIANKDIKKVKEEFDKLESWEKNDFICTVLENDPELYNSVNETLFLPDEEEPTYEDQYEAAEEKLQWVLDYFTPEYIMDSFWLQEDIADYIIHNKPELMDYIINRVGTKEMIKKIADML